ncbi:hypothetical protein C9426_32720 [Serratia sp. S1B]|nr:hypothetical protein C9426_32720 [Serratia sp. S1B]
MRGARNNSIGYHDILYRAGQGIHQKGHFSSNIILLGSLKGEHICQFKITNQQVLIGFLIFFHSLAFN